MKEKNAVIFFADCSLRKVKIEQRKLHDNSNTLVDMAKVSVLLSSFTETCELVSQHRGALALRYVRTSHNINNIVSYRRI